MTKRALRHSKNLNSMDDAILEPDLPRLAEYYASLTDEQLMRRILHLSSIDDIYSALRREMMSTIEIEEKIKQLNLV